MGDKTYDERVSIIVKYTTNILISYNTKNKKLNSTMNPLRSPFSSDLLILIPGRLKFISYKNVLRPPFKPSEHGVYGNNPDKSSLNVLYLQTTPCLTGLLRSETLSLSSY